MPNFATCFPAAPPEVEGNAESATVVDLFPWTEYEFRVFAANTLGTGEPSSPTAKDKTLDAGEDAGVETVIWCSGPPVLQPDLEVNFQG